LSGRKGIRPVKEEWWGAGMVICLQRGADLHMAQLMSLPFTVSCFIKIQIGFTFLVPAKQGSPGKGPLNVCVYYMLFALSAFTLLAGRQEEHPACKNRAMRCCVVICLERGADCLHMVQLMPLLSPNPIISCII